MPEYKTLNDQVLFDLIKADDQTAYTELYDRYKEILHRYAYKWLQEREIVKDIIQDLFITLWTKRGTLTLPQNVAGYLYTSVRYAILRAIQEDKRKNNYALALQEYADKGISITDHQVREKQLQAIIEKEISALPEKMREVFELSRINHLTYAEIAQQLDLSEHTVRNHVKKALKILRSRLGLLAYLYLLLRY
ncbi:RNA polymerase sigma-70 factor, ECF subfamily [Chitinophaga costaii]|uniref:RNA polymerase sigma-70 factor, ECF subfamily n=1 Tax=Chitinophaga costaii TaxID=1335309 RepID=A0A1C4ELV5_9BACT|nr:RNA polymerase sigma-70 factor [Chitinophaga costaii]PUZ22433.1 RNA polymerase sigma-70 factor [Chitinophaga costaii]SCC44553.1 RNA polymerase sigma-70 factor, ECF subfamily [Chitinophaga costaii]